MDSLVDVSLTSEPSEPSPEKSSRDKQSCERSESATVEDNRLLGLDTDSSEDCTQLTEKHASSYEQKHTCVEAMTHCACVLNRHYGRELIEAATTLQSLCNVQDTSLGLIENRHRELIDIRETYQLDEVIEEAQSYYIKMLRLKKEMAALTTKSRELTKRAAHVKDVRAKEQAKKDEERKRLEQLEKDLEPRYASVLSDD